MLAYWLPGFALGDFFYVVVSAKYCLWKQYFRGSVNATVEMATILSELYFKG